MYLLINALQFTVFNNTNTASPYSDVLSFLNNLTAISVSLLHDSTYNLIATAHGYSNYTGTINCTGKSSLIEDHWEAFLIHIRSIALSFPI